MLPASRDDVIALQVGAKRVPFAMNPASCQQFECSVQMLTFIAVSSQMVLDDRLQERQARETGVCPVREELYSQCFGAPLNALLCFTPSHIHICKA